MLSHAYTPRRIHNDYFGIDVGLRGNWLLTVITASCAAGFLLVGYDNGVMGGVVGLGEFNKTFNNPDANTIGNIVSLYEIGCFFGALSTFVIGDFLGRRRTILLSSLVMIAGAIIQAASSSVGVMILGRIVSGLGMGAINSTVPIMQAETSPAVSRGKLVCLDLTVLNFGIVISYWTDYAFGFSGLTGSKIWRIPIALQCVFIVVLMACTLVIPDTLVGLPPRAVRQRPSPSSSASTTPPSTPPKFSNPLPVSSRPSSTSALLPTPDGEHSSPTTTFRLASVSSSPALSKLPNSCPVSTPSSTIPAPSSPSRSASTAKSLPSSLVASTCASSSARPSPFPHRPCRPQEAPHPLHCWYGRRHVRSDRPGQENTGGRRCHLRPRSLRHALRLRVLLLARIPRNRMVDPL